MKNVSLIKNQRRHTGLFWKILSLVVWASMSGCYTSAHAQEDAFLQMKQRFQRELDRLQQKHGFPGATAAFILPDRRYASVATGYADLENEVPMTPQSVMPAGSIGKSFVAAVALSLVNEGTLGLDDTIERWFESDAWFPRLPNGKELTLRMLLNHSSGLEDFLDSENMAMALFQTISDSIDFPYSHEEKVQAVLDVRPRFPAGQGYYYTDTNYILAGLIIERATGESYYDVVRKRFIDPLELTAVTPSNRRDIPHLAAGYMPEDNRFRLPRKVTEDGALIYDPSVEWTAGGLAATATDLVRWAKVLYGGTAMTSDYLDEMVKSANGNREEQGFEYGLGIQLMEMSPGKVYGHGGWIFGYVSGTYYFPEHDVAVAIQINTPDRNYTQYAEALAEVIISQE